MTHEIRTTPTARRRRGMTLIEVLMALVILAGALLGMGRFVTSFAHATSDGALTSTASDLVLDRLEQVAASKPYLNLPSYAATEASIPGFPNFTRVTRVLRTTTAAVDYTAITVSVSHPSMHDPVKKSTLISAF